MDEAIWRICGLAILVAVVSLMLKPLRGDFSALLRIGACVLIFGWGIPTAWRVVSESLSFLAVGDVEPYVSVMLRALGIALLTRICTDICRDCGEGGTAAGVELAGKISILTLCVPLMGEIVGYAMELLQME